MNQTINKLDTITQVEACTIALEDLGYDIDELNSPGDYFDAINGFDEKQKKRFNTILIGYGHEAFA